MPIRQRVIKSDGFLRRYNDVGDIVVSIHAVYYWASTPSVCSLLINYEFASFACDTSALSLILPVSSCSNTGRDGPLSGLTGRTIQNYTLIILMQESTTQRQNISMKLKHHTDRCSLNQCPLLFLYFMTSAKDDTIHISL